MRVPVGSRRRLWEEEVVVVVLGVLVVQEERVRGGRCRGLSRGVSGGRGSRASMTLLECKIRSAAEVDG